jgi:putative glutathione S-transferase
MIGGTTMDSCQLQVKAQVSKTNHNQKESEKIVFGKVATNEISNEISEKGAFVRQNNRFVTPFGDGENELPVEANRYRLIWTPLCPWATRQVIAFKLLGLESVISIGTVSPVRTKNGWEFSLDEGGVDPVLGIRYLPEIYAATDPDYSGRATVPTIVDVKTGKVVNNDYHRLTNYLETVWKPFHKEDAPELYPERLRKEIDELNDLLFHEINNGVYKAGFAHSQEEYEKNYDLVFRRLDWLEEHLGNNRFLFGDALTDSDIRLYVTLARFDTAYYFGFRLNKKRIRDYDNLWNYAKELYSIPAFREATDFDAIKRGYLLGSHSENPYQILPIGPDNSVWEDPNNRVEKFGALKYRY